VKELEEKLSAAQAPSPVKRSAAPTTPSPASESAPNKRAKANVEGPGAGGSDAEAGTSDARASDAGTSEAGTSDARASDAGTSEAGNALLTSTPGPSSAASASEELAEKLRCQLLGGDGASSGESDGGLSNPKSFKFQPLESMPCTFHFAWDTTRGDWTAAIPLMRNSKWRIEDSPQNYKLIWPGSSKRDVWTRKLCMDDAARVEFEANLRTQCEEFVANCTASVRIPRTAIFPGPFVLALMCSVQAVVKALFEKLHDDRSYRRIWTDAMKAKRTMPPPSAREQ
jgi:hypothetical protein